MGRTASSARLVAIAILVVLTGCVTPGTVVNVSVDPATIAGAPTGASNATRLEVTDIRREAGFERTTIGGISMGQIALTPGEAEIVRMIVRSSLDKSAANAGAAMPEVVRCGIRAFDVATPATALYWEVTATVEIVLRVGDRDRIVSGKAAERTYVWPSAEMIQRVTDQALGRLAAESDAAVAELLRPPR